MTRKILWVVVSFLLVAALVLASCAKEEVVEEEEEEEEEPAVGEPQYGGTLTHIGTWTWGGGPDNWDPTQGMQVLWATPYLERLLQGDIDKHGPRGTNEFSFGTMGIVPEEYLGGLLAESWEWTTPLTLVYQIRPGVYWAGKEHVMASRELTAYDVEFAYNYYIYDVLTPEAREGYFYYLDSVTATDTYTVVIEFKTFFFNWAKILGYGSGWPYIGQIFPEEMVEAGIEDWRNQVGTGPFILTDYVYGSYATYSRNPDYWGTTTINGKEYPIPFVDELVFPIIPDESARIAALRTGKVDWMGNVAIEYMGTLTDTSPDLTLDTFLREAMDCIVCLRTDQEPFNKKEVRRALMVGTDYEALIDTLFPYGEIVAWPFYSLSPYHTPLDELPESAQVLYSNDPDLAAQMLADEGYPHGFPMKITISGDSLIQQDVVSLYVDQWARFGVEVEINVVENVLHGSMVSDADYEDAIMRGMGIAKPEDHMNLLYLNPASNTPHYDNSWFVEQYALMTATPDLAERTALFKELAVFLLDEVAIIPHPIPVLVNAYWPWVKNYYGEIDCGEHNYVAIEARIWIDEVLKAEMGY